MNSVSMYLPLSVTSVLLLAMLLITARLMTVDTDDFDSPMQALLWCACPWNHVHLLAAPLYLLRYPLRATLRAVREGGGVRGADTLTIGRIIGSYIRLLRMVVLVFVAARVVVFAALSDAASLPDLLVSTAAGVRIWAFSRRALSELC